MGLMAVIPSTGNVQVDIGCSKSPDLNLCKSMSITRFHPEKLISGLLYKGVGA